MNFGEPGMTKGILINFAKGNALGKLEVILGGTTGTLIAESISTRSLSGIIWTVVRNG